MSEVKRYNPELEKDIGLGLPCLSMLGNPYGEWVHYQDYAELKAQRDALAAEVSAIREQAEDVYAAGYRHGHVNTVDGIAYVTPVEDEFYHNALQVMLGVETPTTDAYLNSVRAECAASVGTLIRACAHEFPDSVEDIVEECAMIADIRAIILLAGEPS